MDKIYSLAGKRVFVAGGSGLAGSAVVRALRARGDCEVLAPPRAELDLCDQRAVQEWFEARQPDVVVMAAGYVGGIGANVSQPADFIYRNVLMAINVINNSYLSDIDRLIYLGSSCIYPKHATLPLTPSSLIGGALEETNSAYAMAKLTGIEMCSSYRRQHGCDFISALPCNLYGVGDHFDAQRSHVVPALMMRAHDAKVQKAPSLSVWGSGNPLREFLYADDLAQALLVLLEHYNSVEPVNIGAAEEISIRDLATFICRVVGYGGDLVFDQSQPDGVQSKLMDSLPINEMGWRAQMPLGVGLKQVYEWYVNDYLAKECAA